MKNARVIHSHASRGYPWPSHGLYLTSLSQIILCLGHLTGWWVGDDLCCNMFLAVTQGWPQQAKIQQVSWVTQIEPNNKRILWQTLLAVLSLLRFTQFKIILTHHLHLYGSGEVIGSSVVLECHNTSVIPFIYTADNADDKPGPLRVSFIEAIHQAAVLESGRKTFEFWDSVVKILV